ncbi:WYL domain-containing protein [Rhodococcus sp. NPDC049939]|uniref:helix-turn-helix transcriptional regulator n=1 Tax=Rhodococcus sp. NPDC049939 TaxID=3155511 RepID=UPI0033DCA1C7
MRASRLVELLVRLQLRGGASATELAAALEVSVRTVYRDVDALSAAGVPIYTEVGRGGGIRIDPAYRIAGLPRLDAAEARGVLFAIVPAIADQLGFDAAAADHTLLPAMERSTETAARVVRDRLLVEPTHWFVPPDEAPALADIAKAVWESREARLTYRGTDVVVRPLGLILKGSTWYLLGQVRFSAEEPYRLFRLSRVEAVELRDIPFERPPGFNLAAAWTERRQAFLASLPEYVVTVRVAPAAEPFLALLDEGSPELPLPDDIERDEHGWARLRLRFERSPDATARHLLRLGADIEILDPPELRERMADAAAGLAALYRDEV